MQDTKRGGREQELDTLPQATDRATSMEFGSSGKVDGGTLSLWRMIAAQRARVIIVLCAGVVGWAFLAWLALDMSTPFAQLTMPASPNWSVAETGAIVFMWAVMMAAMMLPSALPMIVTFAHVSARGGEDSRAGMFVAAYLLVWSVFSVAAAALQWLLQRADWVNPMIVSTSTVLSAVLLLIAGAYQFTPLKRVCLATCRTPLGFLLGDWKPGLMGAFRMGLRHGLLCTGCCWALMVLLFVGGVMNLAWIAAVSIAVAVEKMAPGGDRIAPLLGGALIAAGLIKLAVVGIATG
jgi:predicted metal-binding membrane protein